MAADVASTVYVDGAIAAIPQSDWNQTNATSSDYIENKPDLALKENVSNKVLTVNVAGTDVQYPSARAVFNNVVKNYGDEGIDGVKTFSSIPQIPTASLPSL